MDNSIILHLSIALYVHMIFQPILLCSLVVSGSQNMSGEAARFPKNESQKPLYIIIAAAKQVARSGERKG